MWEVVFHVWKVYRPQVVASSRRYTRHTSRVYLPVMISVGMNSLVQVLLHLQARLHLLHMLLAVHDLQVSHLDLLHALWDANTN